MKNPRRIELSKESLAELKLSTDPPPVKGNLYAPWITGNNDPGGAYAMGNFLNDYQDEYPGGIDEKKALEIYSKAMNYEEQNFTVAAE